MTERNVAAAAVRPLTAAAVPTAGIFPVLLCESHTKALVHMSRDGSFGAG